MNLFNGIMGEPNGIGNYLFCNNNPVDFRDPRGLWYLKGYGEQTVAVAEPGNTLSELGSILGIDYMSLPFDYKKRLPESLQVDEEVNVSLWINPLRLSLEQQYGVEAQINYLKDVLRADQICYDGGFEMGFADVLVLSSTSAGLFAGSAESLGVMFRLEKVANVFGKCGDTDGVLGGFLSAYTVYKAMDEGDTPKVFRNAIYGEVALGAILVGNPLVGACAGVAALADGGSELYFEHDTKKSNLELRKSYRSMIDRVPSSIYRLENVRSERRNDAARARRILTQLNEYPSFNGSNIGMPRLTFEQRKANQIMVNFPSIPQKRYLHDRPR